jgi:hypothetical protein
MAVDVAAYSAARIDVPQAMRHRRLRQNRRAQFK